MSKHTPGPWKLLKFGDDEHYVVTDQSGTHAFHRELSTVAFGFREPAETEQHANAKLIAAAPDLLEVVRDFLESGFDVAQTPLRIRALAAITKATS